MRTERELQHMPWGGGDGHWQGPDLLESFRESLPVEAGQGACG